MSIKAAGNYLKDLCSRRRGNAPAWALFLATFIFYLFTAPQTIFTNDNAEFVTAAAVGGVPHPSGYPLFVLLSWLFAKLPIGSMAYRVNILSGFFAAASLVMIYFLLIKLSERLDPLRRLPSYAAAVMVAPLAVTQMFWFQAIVAKTYTLNLFLVLTVIYLIDKYLDERRIWLLYAIALVAGFGLSNHLMFALIFPFLAVLLVRRGIWSAKRIFICLGMFILGLLPYLYIPIRAAAHPPLNWGNATSLQAFWHFVTRSQYNDLGGSAFFDKLQYLSLFFLDTWEQFGWLLLFAVLGIIWIFKFSKRDLYLMSAVIVANVLGIIILRGTGFNYVNGEFSAPYYLPAYAMIYIFIIAGAWFVARPLKKYAAPIAALFFLTLSVFFVLANWPANDMHGFKFIDDLSLRSIASLPKDAVLVVSTGNAAGDTVTFSIMYQKYAARVRPDVAIIGMPDVFAQIDANAVNEAFANADLAARRQALIQYAVRTYPGRSVYATFPFIIYDKGSAACYVSRSNGYVYGKSAKRYNDAPLTIVSSRDKQILEQDIFGQQYLAGYYFTLAANRLRAGDPAGAMADLTSALGEDPMPGSLQFIDFQKSRRMAP